MSGEVLSPDEYLPGINVYVEHLPLAGGFRFETHVHREHQVVWAASSSILVAVGEHPWVLPSTLALWVPAGVEHTTSASRAAAMRGVYVHPQIPSPWREPTVVAVTAVVRELIDLLSDVELLGPTRERAESLLLDLLRPVYPHAITLPMPVPARARGGPPPRGASVRVIEHRTLGPQGRCQRADPLAALRRRDRAHLQPVADQRPDADGAHPARCRRSDLGDRFRRRLQHAERVHRRLPADDRRHAGQVLPRLHSALTAPRHGLAPSRYLTTTVRVYVHPHEHD